MTPRIGSSVRIAPSSSSIQALKSYGPIDVADPLFHGIRPRDGGYQGPMPTPELHPHLQLEKTMTSIPKVYPGDAVFWHCDVVHAVEHDHNGTGDSAGESLHPIYDSRLVRIAV